MKKVAIFYCQRIKDRSCIACTKCFKAIDEKAGEFTQHGDAIEIVAMTDCGDCPGLLVPRAGMVASQVQALGMKIDAIHLGTCIKMAREHGNCPMDPDMMKRKLEAKFKVPVIVGTHTYV